MTRKPSLPAAALALAFPFHLEFDRQLRITAVGASMRRLSPNTRVGTVLGDTIRIERPSVPSDFDALCARCDSLFILGAMRPEGANVALRGQMVYLETEDSLLFLGTPWVRDVEELQRLGLSLNDFALHDGTADLLHVLRVQTLAADENRALAEKLQVAYQKVRDSSSRLSALIRNLSDAVLVEDERRHMVLTNKAFCDMFQIDAPPEALIGVDCAEAAEHSRALFKDPAAFIAGIERTLQGKSKVQGAELELVDGRVFARDYVPIFDDNQYRGHLWQYRDVTDAKRAAAELVASERRKGAVLETALDAIVTIDEAGLIVEWNPAAVELFGWTREEAIGQEMGELIVPEQYRAAHCDGMQRLLGGAEPRVIGQRLRLHAVRKSGKVLPCELAITEIPSSEGRMFTGFLRDASERERAEQALRTAKELAEQASHAKTDFLATMSHEMRTPLNAILGMTELLAETSLLPEQAEYLTTLSAAGEALLALISDFLDFSKIEAGQLEIDEISFDPADVLQSVLKILAPRARDRAVTVRSTIGDDVPRSVRGDRNRLRQVLLNLVGNAVKFTDHGDVTIEATLRPAVSSDRIRIRFTVRDAGVGMSTEEQQRVFDSFYQADGAGRRRAGGTGLGLAICRSLAELMEGGVWIERSEPGVGSEFCFEATFGVADVVQTGRSSSPAPHGMRSTTDAKQRAARVLVAEDNHDNWRIIERILEMAGHCVERAEDGASATAMFSPGRYDLVLMDVELPVLDGIEAAARIRARELAAGSPKTPIIALTAHALEDVRRRCLDAGMDEFLVKPVRKSLLLAAIGSRIQQGSTVLVVDDSAESRAVTLRQIENSGRLRSCWARSGTRALQMLEVTSVACIVLDLEMPEMTGLEMIKEIRGRLNLNTPVVVLSGHTDPQTMESCLQAGCNRYLVKPVKRRELLAALDELVPVPGLTAAFGTHDDGPILVDVDPDIADLVHGFLEERRGEVNHLRALCEEGCFDEIRVIGHNIKGSAGAYGFDGLGDVGAALEVAGRDRDAHGVEAQRQRLDDYLKRLTVAMAEQVG